jgi:hypothetical protein
LPRRLGDDPLARAKASALAGPDSSGRGGPGISSRASYNDVFFQRRGEEGDSAITIRPPDGRAEPQAAQEISEISEIPEIREVPALPEVQDGRGAAAVDEGERAPDAPQAPEPQQAPAVVEVGSVEVVTSGAPVAEPATRAEPSPVVEEARPEPQNGGGLLKRLFGRFGK